MRRVIGEIIDHQAVFSQERKHHLEVLHLNYGERIEVLTSEGVYLAEVTSFNPPSFKILEKRNYYRELNIDITLFFPLIKPSNLEWGIEKAVELGVNNICLFSSQRTADKLDSQIFARKRERFQKIADQAAEQANRDRLVKIQDIMDIENIYKIPFDYQLVPYEKESLSGHLLDDSLHFESGKTLSLIVGPEGGFSEKEIEKLVASGYRSFSLGKRILRAETAVISALSIIGYKTEAEHDI